MESHSSLYIPRTGCPDSQLSHHFGRSPTHQVHHDSENLPTSATMGAFLLHLPYLIHLLNSSGLPLFKKPFFKSTNFFKAKYHTEVRAQISLRHFHNAQAEPARCIGRH